MRRWRFRIGGSVEDPHSKPNLRNLQFFSEFTAHQFVRLSLVRLVLYAQFCALSLGTQLCALTIVRSLLCAQFSALSLVRLDLRIQFCALRFAHSVLCTQLCALSFVGSVLCAQNCAFTQFRFLNLSLVSSSVFITFSVCPQFISISDIKEIQVSLCYLQSIFAH